MHPLLTSDPHFADVHRLVQRDGLTIQGVLGDALTPSWSYTIGLTDHDLPEIVAFGLPPQAAAHALRVAAAHSIAEALPTGRDILVPLDGLEVCFLPVPPERWDDTAVFGIARTYYRALGRPMVSSGLQLVWPDEDGWYPWHDDYDPTLRLAQPILADGDVIPEGEGGFHPDCVCCRAERAEERTKAQAVKARARTRRRARKRAQKSRRR